MSDIGSRVSTQVVHVTPNLYLLALLTLLWVVQTNHSICDMRLPARTVTCLSVSAAGAM